MARLKRAHFACDAEKISDEILEMRREFDQQVGFRLDVERFGIGARGHEAFGQCCAAGFEMSEEGGVEPHQPLAPVQILESQSVFETKFGHCDAVSAERAVDITPIFLWKWNDSTSGRRCFLRE